MAIKLTAIIFHAFLGCLKKTSYPCTQRIGNIKIQRYYDGTTTECGNAPQYEYHSRG